MSRITGSDALKMFEAYNAVYAPQELTEEQVWEEVENWVNSLLEEGYDLSEYTWEEMYEAYIEELSIRDVTAGARQNLDRVATATKNFYGAAFQGYLGQKTTSKNPLSRAANATSRGLRDIAGAGLQGYTGQKTTSTNPVSRAFNATTRGTRDAAAGFVTGKGSKPPEPTQIKPQPSNNGVKKDPKGAVIVSHFEKENDSLINEAEAQVAPITGSGGKGWYQKNKEGKYVPITDPKLATKAAERWKSEKARSTKPEETTAQRHSKLRSELEKDYPTRAAQQPPTATSQQPPTAPASPTGGRGKLAPTPTKPAASAQTGDKAKDMATWAKANPKLAAAAAEKARIRGTQQTDNPLMKSMKSRLPMNSPSVQAPAVSNLGKGNQSLSQNPNAFKAAPPKPVATSTAPEVKAINTAAAPKLPSVAPKAPTAGRDQMLQRNLRNGMEYDAYDVVLEYLLSQGHAETVEEAHYVMLEMDAEMIGTIVEAKVDEKLPEHERSGARLSRYDNPSGALALGGGQQRARREEHKERRGKKTKG